MLQKRSLAVALLLLSRSAFAAELPSAGTQLLHIPPAPVTDKAAPQLQIEPGDTQTVTSVDQATVVVNSLHVINAKTFSTAELVASTGFVPGSTLNLSALRSLAAKITDYYHSHGYFLAQAILPAQDIVDGVVTIAVVEAQYGKVVVRNRSHLADGLAQQLLDGLNSGDSIAIAPLESRLLQLSDLPGVNVKSTLTPGASVGASDLIVDITPGQRLSGSIEADNFGSRYTGADRVGGTLNINNPAGHGDIATLRVLTSLNGLNYGRGSYQLQWGKADAGAAYTSMTYSLGREFASLQAHGTAQIASFYGRYPLLRSRSTNLYSQFNIDAKTFRDKLDVTTPQTITHKRSQVAMLSLVGDRRDRLGGGGLSMYSLTWSSGSLDLRSPQALSIDAATAHSDGHYDKLGVSLMRLQNVTESLSLYAALQGQLSNRNLDVSEKMSLGGANAVRAYADGAAYVDEGYVLTLEARMPLPKFIERMPGQLQLAGFLDTGAGNFNKNPWDTEKNSRTLNGGGLGLNWFAAGSFTMKANYAHRLGSATSAPEANGQFWINAVKYF